MVLVLTLSILHYSCFIFFSFMCCTKFLDIFIWYVRIGQTKYHLSSKIVKRIKLEHYNSKQILRGWDH